MPFISAINERGFLALLCKEHPETILAPHNERRWDQQWIAAYQTRQQEQSIRFLPLCEVRDERYTVYFPVQERN